MEEGVGRFIVSHRLAGKRTEGERDASFSAFNAAVPHLQKFAEILSETKPSARGRSLMFVNADPLEIEARRRDMHSDLIIEPEMLRTTARYFPIRTAGLQPVSPESGAAGIGATVELTV